MVEEALLLQEGGVQSREARQEGRQAVRLGCQRPRKDLDGLKEKLE